MISIYNKQNINILIKAIKVLEKKGYTSDKKWNEERIKQNDVDYLKDAAKRDCRKFWNYCLMINEKSMVLLNHIPIYGESLEINRSNFNKIIKLIQDKISL